SSPITPVGSVAKSRHLLGFSPLSLGQPCPSHCPAQPGAFLRGPGPVSDRRGAGLGTPLDIRAVARLIGCSPWTVRQTAIPRGLPHFRFGASGRLIFYRDQIIRWIENQ